MNEVPVRERVEVVCVYVCMCVCVCITSLVQRHCTYAVCDGMKSTDAATKATSV